jgi:hypothetical protein
MKATHCRFSIACNDHRNGSFLGNAVSFQFEFFAESKLIAGCEIDSKYCDIGMRVSFACDPHARGERSDQGIIVLGTNHAMPFRSYRAWVGNWCWDSMLISTADAVRLLHKLRRSAFHLDEACQPLWDWWESIEVAPHHQSRPKGTPEQ